MSVTTERKTVVKRSLDKLGMTEEKADHLY
jgi:hypothetical protein